MDEDTVPVTLHVYDLSNGMAAQLSQMLLGTRIDGIWHTGICIRGDEIFFGGGIQIMREGTTPFGRPLQVIPLGHTAIDRATLDEFLAQIQPRFSGTTYHLMENNCNHFTDEVSQFLLGSGIPPHIVGLPQHVLSTPLGAVLGPMINQMQARMNAEMGPSWQPGAAAGQHPQPAATTPTPMTGSAHAGPALPPRPAPPPPRVEAAVAAAAGVEPAVSQAQSGSQSQSQSDGDAVGEAARRAAFKSAVQSAFASIMAGGGVTANEAAVMALKRVTDGAA